MDNCFVRKDFYIDPPKETATPKEWFEWAKKDDRKARAAKAAHTRSLEHSEVPEEFQSGAMMKVGGVWRQSVAIGFSGDADSEGGCNVQPIVESDQEKIAILHRLEMNRNKRGGTKSGKSARRRANRKANRKAK